MASTRFVPTAKSSTADFLQVPGGSTAQRPATAPNGSMRQNDTDGEMELFQTSWRKLRTKPVGLTSGMLSDSYSLNIVTSNATQTALEVGGAGGGFIALANNTSYYMDIHIAAATTSATFQSGAWRIRAHVRNEGGVASLPSAALVELLHRDSAAWDVTVGVASGGLFKVLVTGTSGTTLRWHAVVDATGVPR